MKPARVFRKELSWVCTKRQSPLGVRSETVHSSHRGLGSQDSLAFDKQPPVQLLGLEIFSYQDGQFLFCGFHSPRSRPGFHSPLRFHCAPAPALSSLPAASRSCGHSEEAAAAALSLLLVLPTAASRVCLLQLSEGCPCSPKRGLLCYCCCCCSAATAFVPCLRYFYFQVTGSDTPKMR